MKEITSLGNAVVKDVCNLKQKKYRERSASFVVEGLRAVEEAVRYAAVQKLFTVPDAANARLAQLLADAAAKNIELYSVTEQVMKKMSDTEAPQGVLAVCSKPQGFIVADGTVLVLDRVADPGNVGTLIRTAEAAGIAPDVRMNPILLKPTSDSGSQVIVNGEIYGTMRAQEYYTKKQELIPYILKAYHALAAENDIIVLEGAGSPAEINLKSVDIVNLGMAELSDSPAILVGDIDRGGVFASLYGTIMLLDDAERRRIQGIVINKFRGDVEILKSGLTMLEELTGIPVLGVVPYLPLELDDEDSLSERLSRREAAAESLLDVAVIRFPRISNFTDFEALEQVEGVSVRYVSRRGELGTPDMILLAGTKSTMADLRWLRQSGLEAELLKCHEKGVFLMGICGGFQMLGKRLCDPEQVEDGGELRGMGLLDVETVFRPEKHRAQTAGTVARLSGQLEPLSGCAVRGYEIHMGETVYTETAQPFAMLTDGRKDGCVCADGTVCGTYLHGIFDTPELTQKLVQLLLEKKGISGTTVPAVDFAAKKEQEYDKLADLLREHLDMPKIYDILNSWGKTP